MQQKVYLSDKKVYLSIDFGKLGSNAMAFEVANEIMGALIPPCKVVGPKGHETMTPELGAGNFSLNVSAFSAIRMEDGRLGTIVSISRPGLVGMYFYRQGEDHMTEMVNPETQKVTEIVSGEKEDIF